MTTAQRTRFQRTLLLGLLLTSMVMGLDALGALTPLDNWLYDQRARYFQFFTPPPTRDLVHLDLDDGTLQAMGNFPWPRADLGRIIDEIRLAGASTLALDIVFPEKSRFAYNPDGTPGPWPDDDLKFAEAIKAFGRVLVPMILDISVKPKPGPVTLAIHDVLEKNPHFVETQVIETLTARAIGTELDTTTWNDLIFAARRQVYFRKILTAMSNGPFTKEQARRLLLGATDSSISGGRATLLDQQFEIAQATMRLKRSFLSLEAAPVRFVQAHSSLPPTPVLAEQAAITGFVDHLPDEDGKVRWMPLWVEYEGRIHPQFSLAAACLALGVEIEKVRITPGETVIPRPDGSAVRIPTARRKVGDAGERFGGFMPIPWFGASSWETMYDHGRRRDPVNHLPLTEVWSIIADGRHIERNMRMIDEAIMTLLQLAEDAQALPAFEKMERPPGDLDLRRRATASIFKDSSIQQYYEASKDVTDDESAVKITTAYTLLLKLEEIFKQSTLLQEQIAAQRLKLKSLLGDKIVLIGWTATGAGDSVTTSLHANCPGVVVHGAILNGILTGDVWEAGASWVTPASTFILGLITTIIAGLLSPMAATIWVFVLVAAWLAFNGLVLFDHGDIATAAAGPAVCAMGIIWAAATLGNYLAERVEKAKITRRFRSYVDPALVDYVLENPQLATLSGQVKELSVVFTDLAGFTTVSEKLGAATVPLLNEYMGLMVPVVRERGGYVNKFLGDGIMFFFGAPRESTTHAVDAVATVLKMQKVLKPFNETLTARGLPNVKMRAGVTTGELVVGDAGPPDASDYTVLGDVVNLSARLESANKATGTLIMINDRTVELLGGQFLVRPLAKLQVVGKSQGVLVYEPMAYMNEATEEQKRLAELTGRMVETFAQGQFVQCLKLLDELDEKFGRSKLVDLYRRTCRQHLVEPPEDFTGSIVLTDK